MTEAPLLDIRDVAKSYGDTPALRGVSLRVKRGAIVCLLGPSGCGKTTLLRLIAGLERPDSGAIYFDGEQIDIVPVHERGFGLMFQDYALFPHRDVAGNVAFGLRMQNQSREQIRARVAEMLELVGLSGYDRRRVYELSGGERQRVALARSLAPSPPLLMLDEPLGALDRALRERLLDDLRGILKRVGVTSVYVTHDQAEAYAIADWLVLMNRGVIEQQGSPAEVYQNPASLFAARFLGFPNLVPAHALDATTFETALGRFRIAEAAMLAPGAAATLVLRPEGARIADGEGTNIVGGEVVARSFRGSRTRLTVRHASGQELEFDLDDIDLPKPGMPITLKMRPSSISVIEGTDEGR